MRYVVAFLRFWYDFLLGDDWKIAGGVVVTLLLTWAAVHLISHTAAGAVLLAGVVIVSSLAFRRSVLEG